jgi:N-terminal acetyltransferase B complex non-catalytic subunit
MEWATAVSDWLEPYHDHTRPPPAVVLAEANKQNELRTGLPLRGVDLKALNGDANANGHAKKDEEAPPVKEPPQLVAQFFERTFNFLRMARCLLFSQICRLASCSYNRARASPRIYYM